VAIACRRLGLLPAEAITAATWNAACVLGVQDMVGSLAPGKRADLQMLDAEDERELAHEMGGPGPLLVILGGRIVASRGIVSGGEDFPEDDEDSPGFGFDPDEDE
jgi:imidazolonepropionase-like amidohydrolase